MVVVRRGRRTSRPGTVQQQLAGVGVDEAQGVLQHVCGHLLQEDQVAAHCVLTQLHLAVGLRLLCAAAAALACEQLPEELGPHGQDVLVGGEGAVAGLQCHVVDAVRLVGLLQQPAEVLREGGGGDDGDLKQAAEKEQGKQLAVKIEKRLVFFPFHLFLMSWRAFIDPLWKKGKEHVSPTK